MSLDESNMMMFLVVPPDKKLCVIHIILKVVIFYWKPPGSLLFIRFTSNHSTSLLELSTGFPVLLRIYCYSFWDIVYFWAKLLSLEKFWGFHFPWDCFSINVNVKFGFYIESGIFFTRWHFRNCEFEKKLVSLNGRLVLHLSWQEVFGFQRN